VLQDYDKVGPPYTFGDVLFFMGDDGGAFHSCVYIADNLVYTKNGENEMQAMDFDPDRGRETPLRPCGHRQNPGLPPQVAAGRLSAKTA